MMTNIELIKEFYRSFRECDNQAFRQICTDDLEWIQYEGLPHRLVFKGAGAIFAKISQSDRNKWEGLTYHIETILEAGSAVVVLGHQEGSSPSNSTTSATSAHVYDIRDHKVCRLRIFDHTHLMLQALSLSPCNLATQSA
ncbi:MAG: nuclear transport factor 2 family protein [Cyanobacteria bacterium J06639_14]